MSPAAPRATWVSRLGFVLAAAGSAVGLGNLWRFPYITGENGGGLFVVIYLLCIVLVGLPILITEIVLGRASRCSTVGAFRRLAAPRSPWVALGWMGVAAASMVLTAYAVVAGWALHYTLASLRGAFRGLHPEAISAAFGEVYADGRLSLLWALVFMLATVAVVIRGVRQGLERWVRVLMPLLFLLLLILLAKAVTLPGFGEAVSFVFGLNADRLTPAGVLEALGHSFFTLGVGVGIMIVYGSYLPRQADIVRDGVAVAVLDTVIALLACLVIFPIIFSYGLEPGEGPGLIFVSLPIAFAQMPAGSLLAIVFFALVVFAALTSSISMLEVSVAYLSDERGWSRRRATLTAGVVVSVLVVPAALSGSTRAFGEEFAAVFGKNWFDLVIDTVSNWLMPLGGLGFALFAGWRLKEVTRREQFPPGLAPAFYRGWLLVLRFVVPIAVVAIFLHAVGVL